jgi:xanthine dehydrogenase accessory factor
MNFSLLDRIDSTQHAFLATVLATEGHTYKKRGARALFVPDRPAPVWGNLGSLCVDQELVRVGTEALADGRPQMLEIDTSQARDIDFGYGTYCGGKMNILVEPVFTKHKAVYAVLGDRLRNRTPCYLVHDINTGDITVADTAPAPDKRMLVEEIQPLQRLCIFGATPLARRVIHHLADMDFEIKVMDWRPAHLESLDGLIAVTCHGEDCTLDSCSFVLVMSHDFRRDKEVIRRALAAGCGYIGMLSSSQRRDQLYRELREDSVEAKELERISSPVGLDIGGRSDAEIAISIVAEIVSVMHS